MWLRLNTSSEYTIFFSVENGNIYIIGLCKSNAKLYNQISWEMKQEEEMCHSAIHPPFADGLSIRLFHFSN